MSGIVAQNVGRPSGLVKAVEAGGGTWVEIKTLTSDGSDATMSFVDGTDDVVLDSTYPVYCFKFTSIHPETDDTSFTFQGNAVGESGYNETMSASHFKAYITEADGTPEFAYESNNDQARGTDFLILAEGVGGDADHCCSGELYLFGPSSTVGVKHFMCRISAARHNDSIKDEHATGYFEINEAVDEIQFKMSSGEIQGGKIKLFGIKDS